MILILLSSNPAIADEFKVAVRAHKGIEHGLKQWNPTVTLLSEKIKNHTFTLVPIVSLNELTVAAGEKKFHFVLTNPSSYVEIQQLHGASALATLNNKRKNTAQSTFGSVIFTHVHNTDIVSIQDLKNKKLIAVSKPAFGGWRVAWQEMLAHGFNPQTDLDELLFAKSRTQPEVVEAVLNKKAHAGVVRTDLLERLADKGKIDMRYLRIINNQDIHEFPFFLSTQLYPEWAFAALSHVPEPVVQQVSAALMSIDKNTDASKAGKYISWLAPLDYNGVKNLMKELQVGPYAQ